MSGLHLLDPRGLLLLAGLVPLVVLYVLKIQRRRQRVSSTLLWSSARRDLLARHPLRKLLPEVPLLLEILALAALAVALARPSSRAGNLDGDHLAVVIDASASMATRMGGPAGARTRMDEAKRRAEEVVSNLAPGADAMVLEAGRDARVVAPLDRDPRRLQAAIAGVAVREVEGNLAAAVALAADRLRSLGGHPRIVVVTDGALAHPEPLAVAGIPTDVVEVGDEEDNAAIVRVDVRSGLDAVGGREQVQAFAMVQSFAARPREAYVTLSIEGRGEPVASRRLLLEPGAKLPVVLTFEPRPEDHGLGLVVELAPADAEPVDDVAFGRVPAALRMPVVVASDAPYSWTTRALEADPEVDLQRLSLSALDVVNVDPDALVIVEGGCPGKLPGRDALLLAPPEGSCFGVAVGPPVDGPLITSWETADPRLRFLTLDGVHVMRSFSLGAHGPGAALVRSSSAVLVADASTPERTVTVVGFDPGDSDWPLKASFVLFVRNVVEQARLHRAQGAAGSSRTGDPARVSVPAGTTTVRVDGPGLPEHDLAVEEGVAVLPPLARAGLYHVRWNDPHVGSALVAVNLTSPSESDVRPRPVLVAGVAAGGATSQEALRALDGHGEWVRWLAFLAALAIVADVAWATRPSRVRGAGALLGALDPAGLAVALLGAVPLLTEGLAVAGLTRETYLRFHRPQGLLFVAAVGLLVGWRSSRLPRRAGAGRRRALVALWALAALGAALVVAEPELGRPLDRLAIVVALDRSRSIDRVPGAEARVRSELEVAERSMRDDDTIGTVVFGSEAAVEDPLRAKGEAPAAQRAEVGRDASDLEAAVRRAVTELPADAVGRVVLVSDGLQTRGDALAAAAAARAADVAVDVVVLEQKLVPDVRVVTVGAPPHADEGEPFELRVVTSSAVPTDLELRVRRDDGEIRVVRTRIEGGEDVVRLRETAGDPGLHRYDVAVTALDPAADQAPDDNVGSAFVRVRGASLALVLEGDAGHGAPLRKALEASGFRAEERSTTGVPADVGGLAAYDLVVLSDVRASDLSTAQIDALAAYARDLGGGLLLMGGDRSMGPGGYARTPIEEVSPVAFDLKQEKRRASLAEVIAIDTSGSMGATVGGHTKLELANEASARSASLLGPGDRLGVEHVDTVVRWTVPMAPVNDAPGIAEKIRGVGVGGGGIYTDIALRAGYEALGRESVNLKHLLLFADGSDAEQIAGCRAIVKSAFDRGMTTSVISLGRGNDSPELEVLSKIGGGRFYLIEDATRLPAVFTQETILAARSAIHELPFQVRLGVPASPTRGVDFARQPLLEGYVVTSPKPRASVLLAGPEDDPVLATWSVGIGRAAAFTSDYKDRWGQKWLAWPEAARLFGQLARDVGRKSDDPRVRLEADAVHGELHVRADVVGDDGRAETFRRLTAHVAGPEGFARDVPLEAVGAGRYAAALPLSRPGTYVAAAKDEVSGDAVGTIGAVLTGGEELKPTGSDGVLLARVAAMTGGTVRDTLAGLFDDRAARRFAYRSMISWLVLGSALAMLLAVAVRRLGVPDVLAALSTHARARREETARRRAERAAETTERQALAPPGAPTGAPTERPLTAAERLALKRRERR